VTPEVPAFRRKRTSIRRTPGGAAAASLQLAALTEGLRFDLGYTTQDVAPQQRAPRHTPTVGPYDPEPLPRCNFEEGGYGERLKHHEARS